MTYSTLKSKGGLMFSRLRGQLTPTNAVLVLALVFAMSGGALAASKYLITSTKQISPKVLAALKGNTGAGGVRGPSGEAGPPGARGQTGLTGASGRAGANGKEGQEGVEGSEGPAGPKGEPWSPNNTLPKGATESGAWSVQINNSLQLGTVSFPVKLATELEATHVHVIGLLEGEGEEKESEVVKLGECKGTLAAPAAGSGNLCVFVSGRSQVSEIAFVASPVTIQPGAGVSGALLVFTPSFTPEGQFGLGTWAVTG
jgi:hypothetical protein